MGWISRMTLYKVNLKRSLFKQCSGRLPTKGTSAMLNKNVQRLEGEWC